MSVPTRGCATSLVLLLACACGDDEPPGNTGGAGGTTGLYPATESADWTLACAASDHMLLWADLPV